MLVTSIFYFSQNVFGNSFLRVVKSRDCVVKGECNAGFSLNPLPNDKVFGVTKLKAFADDNLNVAKMPISLFDSAENTE